MKKTLLLIMLAFHSFIYSQTFDGNLSTNSLKWTMEQKDFNVAPRANVSAMSLKLWDNYAGSNSPSTYGTLMEVNGRVGHLASQLYFQSTTEGGRIMYRSAFYNQTTWSDWRKLLDSKSDIESSGNLKITGTGNSYITAGNFGIGTINPIYKLQIGEFNNGGTSKLSIPGIYNFEEIRLGQYGNGLNGLEMITHSDQTKSFGVRLYTGTDTGVNGLLIQTADPATSAQNLVYTSKMVVNLNGNVGIGTTAPDEKLTVKGKIHSQEVRIDMSGPLVPDYVFTENYKLKSLQEVEDYIKQNKHLPEIPSAQEIERSGLMIGEMNMNLLKKIEEMTIYIIEQNKQIKDLKSENQNFQIIFERLSKIEQKLNYNKN